MTPEVKTIAARKCQVEKIEDELANVFLDENHSQGSTASKIQSMGLYFGDMRKLCHETGLITPTSKWIWKKLGIWGESSRYRGEPDRTAIVFD